MLTPSRTEMADTRLLSMVKKFDGTNWESWSFSIRSALMFINALDIADGTEMRPPVSSPAKEEEVRRLEDWQKRSRQGLSLLLVSVSSSVHQSLNLKKSLQEIGVPYKQHMALIPG